MSDLHSIVRRIEALHAERDGIADGIADLFQEAKDAKLDLPALRLVIAERRRRAKNPSAYEALKGTAAEYLDALDNGVVVEHARTRAPARGKKSEAATAGGFEGPVRAAGGLSVVASDTPSNSIGGSTPPQPAGNDAPRSSSAATSPLVETETDRAETPEARPRDAEEEEPPRPDSDAGWQARDGHDSYVLALQVANGKVPHPADAGPLPRFLDRRQGVRT